MKKTATFSLIFSLLCSCLLALGYSLRNSVEADLKEYNERVSELVEEGMMFRDLQEAIYDEFGLFFGVGIGQNETISASVVLERRPTGITSSMIFTLRVRLNKLGMVETFAVSANESHL
ncbi:MAG: hypothetical protein ACFE0O_15775 [Opitutales bacterium]